MRPLLRIAALAAVLALASRASGEAGGAAPVILFDPPATLPEAEIRARIEAELSSGGTARGAELHVGVDDTGRLVLSYRVPGELPRERVLRRPTTPEDTTELVALAATTLVRDQSARVAVEPAPSAAAAATSLPVAPLTKAPPANAPTRPSPPAENAPPRTFLGASLGADFLLVRSQQGLCWARFQSADAPIVRCFDSNEEPAYAGNPERAGEVSGGLLTGSTRLVLSVDQALSERFRLGARLGMAFDPIPIEYVPLHAEARATYLFGARSNALRPHVFGGLAFARFTGHTENVIETDDGQASKVDVYASIGWVFVSAGGGLVYQPAQGVELDATLQIFGLPGTGVSVTPSLGVRFGL